MLEYREAAGLLCGYLHGETFVSLFLSFDSNLTEAGSQSLPCDCMHLIGFLLLWVLEFCEAAGLPCGYFHQVTFVLFFLSFDSNVTEAGSQSLACDCMHLIVSRLMWVLD